MKNNIFCILLLSLLGFNSCKKEILQPESINPIFYFNGNVNAQSESIQAGINNYYMYSNIYHDANNVYNFDSHLKKYACTNCTDDIQIIIKDYQTSTTGDPISFSNSISPGYYPYEITGGAPISHNVTFNSFTQGGGGAVSYLWDFGDGNSSTTGPSVNHTYNRSGKYQTCLTVTFTDLSTSMICNEVNIEIIDSSCDFIFSNTPTTGNTIDFSPIQQLGTGPFTYLWDLGDGNTSTSGTTFSHTYASAGIYQACLRVTDANGAICTFCMNVKTNGFVGSIANLNYVSTGNNPNPLSLSNVIINYTDVNGIVYTSLDAIQAFSYFKVLSVDDYEINENGMPTKKVKVQFKCNLKNGANSITISNAEAIIAIAYQ